MDTIEKAAEAYQVTMREVDVDRVYDTIDVDSIRYVAFKAGANWQKEQSPWICVNDHLPMDYNDKLIKLRDGTIRVANYDSGDDEQDYFWHDGPASECFSPGDVTHWMPIPKFNNDK